jgi:holo-[acyl-carrier protein] synthase
MRLAVGIDLVMVSRIASSLELFGDRFLRRIFTEGEIAYATAAPALTAERLAVRFAAKEATMKALGLAGRGVGWRQIEVTTEASGAPAIRLHGEALTLAADAGELALSLSHEGDFATAIVVTHSQASTTR